MRYLIFSDVHANWLGLQYVLRFADQHAVEKLLFLGDIIGYNGYPNECIEALRKYSVVAIKGNHEGLFLNTIPAATCNSERAQYTLRVTRKILTPENLAFLENLPDEQEIEDKFILIHGSFKNSYETINSGEKSLKNLKILKSRNKFITFFGHTHRAAVYYTHAHSNTVNHFAITEDFLLKPDHFYLINPGTAGEPRHQLPMSFLVFDSEAMRIEYHPFELTESEKAELMAHNKKVFGGLKITRIPAQIKERLKKVYYSIT